jgi:hypothetical protein
MQLRIFKIGLLQFIISQPDPVSDPLAGVGIKKVLKLLKPFFVTLLLSANKCWRFRSVLSYLTERTSANSMGL